MPAPPTFAFEMCVLARATTTRARVSRGREERCARERKYARLFLAGVARFVQVARARARDFFPRVQHTETNTIQETKKRGEKRRLSLSRKCPHQQNARLNDARSKNHALLRTRTRTHPSTLPRSTIFTAQNVGDIAEKRDAQYRRRHRRVSRHHHGDGTRRERKFPKVRRGFWTVLLGRECPRGHRKRRFFSTRFFFLPY